MTPRQSLIHACAVDLVKQLGPSSETHYRQNVRTSIDRVTHASTFALRWYQLHSQTYRQRQLLYTAVARAAAAERHRQYPSFPLKLGLPFIIRLL